MAIKLSSGGSKTSPAAAAAKPLGQPAKTAAEVVAPAAQASAPAATITKSAPVAQAPDQAPKKSGVSFLKKGKEGQEAFDKEETKAAMNKNRPFNFFLKNGGEASITFLDGDVTDGALDIPFYYEHFVKIGAKPQRFVCVSDSEPCPLCEDGNEPSFVGVMTVIDHSEYTDSNGKTVKDAVRLFIAKRGTLKTLTKLAIKRDGLRGCRFDVSRTGDKEPGVGNVFDFTHKLTDEQLAALYGEKSKPINYDENLGYLEASELRKLGFGSAKAPIGNEPPAGEDFDKEL